MSKCEKQVVTKLNKKLEKYGLTREELELKLNKSYRYCCNHDVLCGTYDCNMADVVNNSVMCESKECMYNGGDYAKKHFIGMSEKEMAYQLKCHSGAVYGKSVYDLLANMPDEAFPF